MALRDEPASEDDEPGLSRRSLLGAGLFGAVASVLTAAGITVTRGAATEVVGAVAPAADQAGLVTTVAARRQLTAGTTAPTWMHTWADPIARLDSYTARRLAVRFPRRAVMLTIDDGPHPFWTPRYLRLLARYGVTATFNVIGEQVHHNAHLLKAAVGEGHHLGNHTYRHPLNLPSLSSAQIRRELTDTTDAIVRAADFRPRQFRAPGGVWGPDVFAEVARQQMMPLGWDVDPRDWALPGVDAIRQAMLAARPHDIILCHDGGGNRSETYRALETVIPALLARDFQFVTLPAPQ